MKRALLLGSCAVFGLVFLSRSCHMDRADGPIVLTHARIVGATGVDQMTSRLVIAGGRITEVTPINERGSRSTPGREIDVSGFYVAAATFDKTASTLLNGIRHVWVGQIGAGESGDVLIMRGSPARIRPGQIPNDNAIVAAVVDGVYYSARDLARPRRSR